MVGTKSILEGVEILLDVRTYEEWSAITRAIPRGFVCIEMDDLGTTPKIKIGTGYESYSNLRYVQNEISGEYYTKTEILELIASEINALGTVFTCKGKVNTIDDLPTSDNTIGDVWLVGSNEADKYHEYYWTGTLWDYMGLTADVDLDDYYNKSNIDALLDNKVDKIEGKGLSTNDFTNAEKEKLSSLSNYDDTETQNRLSAIETDYVSSSSLLTIVCTLGEESEPEEGEVVTPDVGG